MPTDLADARPAGVAPAYVSDFVPARRPFTGRRALIWAIGFFGVIFAANFVLVKLALETMPGTVVDSAYRAGQAYNGDIAAAREQEARHWRVETHVERSGDGRVSVRAEARDAAGAPLNGLTARAQLLRPTDRRGDVAVGLSAVGAGTFRGTALDVPAGAFDLVLTLEENGERRFLSRNRVVLP
jgi:nitrogen fixation protein FixH